MLEVADIYLMTMIFSWIDVLLIRVTNRATYI